MAKNDTIHQGMDSRSSTNHFVQKEQRMHTYVYHSKTIEIKRKILRTVNV